ncbi:MAG: glycoside hydrolase family 16 protein [Cyclobacteriaceae bacterium]
MKKLILLPALCLATQVLFAQSWSLAWKDEFTKDGLPDTAFWNFEEGNPEKLGAQFFVAGRLLNSRVANGHLFLQLRKDIDSDFPFSSAHIHTKNKIDFRYGRLEIKAKMPKNTNILPTIGLLSKNDNSASLADYGEIMVSSQTRNSKGNLATKVYLGGSNQQFSNDEALTIEKPYIDFHVYIFEWDEESVKLFIDNQLYYQVKRNTDEWPFDKSMYLFINMKIAEEATQSMAINGNFYQQLIIDYIRYYKKHDGNISAKR